MPELGYASGRSAAKLTLKLRNGMRESVSVRKLSEYEKSLQRSPQLQTICKRCVTV